MQHFGSTNKSQAIWLAANEDIAPIATIKDCREHQQKYKLWDVSHGNRCVFSRIKEKAEQRSTNCSCSNNIGKRWKYTKTMPENKDCGLAEGLLSSADTLRRGEGSLFLCNLLASNQTAAAGRVGNSTGLEWPSRRGCRNHSILQTWLKANYGPSVILYCNLFLNRCLALQ